MEPQNFSVNDGDGIRTIIFFGGCPLKCKWCSNPECFIDLKDEGKHNELIYRYSSKDLLGLIEKQLVFYRFSGGGVTFSGGEPTLQKDILRELTNKFYDKSIDLAIETSGYFNFDELKDILGKLNLIFIDIKHMDDEKHKSLTGVTNKRILENIKRINTLNIPLVIRIPLIVGVNSEFENIRKTARFVKENINNPKIELLPYHSLGDEKYEALGREKPSKDFKTPSGEEMKVMERIIKEIGVKVISYR